MEINNPYGSSGTRWLRGEIHAHVNRAEGSNHIFGDGVDRSSLYGAACDAGLDFIFMSVDVLSRNGGANLFGDVGAGDVCGVTGIPAREVQNNYYPNYFAEQGSRYLHVLTLGVDDGVSICAHPLYYQVANPKSGGEWEHIRDALLSPIPDGCLDRLNVSGLEIYNGFTENRLLEAHELEYSDFDEPCWDDLLRSGRPCWGFVGNDSFFNDVDDFGSFKPLGVTYAAVPSGRAARDIVAALRQGQFYSSTGVRLADTPITVSTTSDILQVEVSAREPVHWQVAIHRQRGRSLRLEKQRVESRQRATFTVDGEWRYVRVRCESRSDSRRRAWLQPITNRQYFG